LSEIIRPTSWALSSADVTLAPPQLSHNTQYLKLERNDLSWGFLVPQHSAILSPKAKPSTGRHFAQCPAGGLKRSQMPRTEAVLLGHSGWEIRTDTCLPINERGRQMRRAYIFSETQVRLPHLHSNMWNVRAVGGSSILLRNLDCSPHFKQRGEVGCCAGFSMPHTEFREGRWAS
jgi:hypothetical protein